MGEITREAAERAAQAVIDAGEHWQNFKLAVERIKRTHLTSRTVVALVADECDIPVDIVRTVLDSFIKIPDLIAVAA